MSAETKAKAQKKLAAVTPKVGYPDKARDYSGVIIKDDDLIGNVRRAAAADWAFYVGRSDGLVDKSDWDMTPQTVDAYNGNLRDIVFPAAINADVPIVPAVVRLTINEPTSTAGHNRYPNKSIAANANPVGGQTGDALALRNAIDNPSLPAAT